MMKFYNCNHYYHYFSDCPNRSLAEGGAHMNARNNNPAAAENNNNDNDMLYGGGKANTMLDMMELDNYDPSYNGYDFFQTASITSDTATSTTNPHKNYLEAYQDQRPPPSPPDSSGRITKSLKKSNHSIPDWYVLIDNQSMVDVSRNASLLTNIHQAWKTQCISFNDGAVPITLVGDLKGYRKVCYPPKGITHILSLAWVKNLYRATYDIMRGKFHGQQRE